MNVEKLLSTSLLDLLKETPGRPVVEWFLEEDWRTWVSHLLIVLLVTLLFGWWLVWVPAILTLIYLAREYPGAKARRGNWIDIALDWIFAWTGFGTGMFALEGTWIGVVILLLFTTSLGLVGYAAKRDEV